MSPETEAASESPRSSTCLNCGAPMHGPFCAQCGQRDVPPYPSVRELVVDAFWELSGWDGRFATTVRALFRHPGLLSREFLEGRRARYISPLRLYLMASLVYFVLAAAAPNVNVTGNTDKNFVGVQGTGFKIGTTAPRPGPERVADAAARAQRQNADPNANPDSLTAAQRDAALRDIESAPSIFRPMLRRAIADPGGFKRGLLEAMPRMLFALLPVFALIVSLFYRGRKYPEHLYFAIHLHAFVFLGLALSEIAKFTRSAPVVLIVASAVLLWIPIYATIAFRRTYGGSIVATLSKEIGIGTLYSIAASIGLIATLYVVSVAG